MIVKQLWGIRNYLNVKILFKPRIGIEFICFQILFNAPMCYMYIPFIYVACTQTLIYFSMWSVLFIYTYLFSGDTMICFTAQS